MQVGVVVAEEPGQQHLVRAGADPGHQVGVGEQAALLALAALLPMAKFVYLPLAAVTPFIVLPRLPTLRARAAFGAGYGVFCLLPVALWGRVIASLYSVGRMDIPIDPVAQLHGVQVLNINELANALKPVVLPGETMRVFILKEGKEYNQGVAYLDDGTMVVVDNAKKMISRTIDISVTSVLQTTAGKMIFGRFDDRMHAIHDKGQSHTERPQAAPREQPSPAAGTQAAEARGSGVGAAG